MQSSRIKDKPKTILWLGSSLGNFRREEVPPFLTGFRNALQPGDTMLIGIDSCKHPERVFHAYNDRDNVTHDFTLNGLKHANRIMGYTAFQLEDWEAIGAYNEKAGGHQAFVSPLKDVEIDGIPISKGERIRIEESYKYSREEVQRLWDEAGLVANTIWSNSRGDYGKRGFVLPSPPILCLIPFKAFTLSRSQPSSFQLSQKSMRRIRCHPSQIGTNCGLPGMMSRRK